MLIEILSEDKSGAVVVERLARRITQIEGLDVEVNVHPHRGCGSFPKDMTAKPPKFASSLLDLLPSELRAYNKIYKGKDLILIIALDSDDKDPQELRQEVYAVASKFAPDIRSVVGLSIEEIEAWILGDKAAILEAYPDSREDILDSYEQDSVCGTWEYLCRAISENAEELWAENISRYMQPQRNVSPSFKTFNMALSTALKNPVPIYRKREF